MSVIFETSDASKLLNSFKKQILEGAIVTWAVDSDGDFFHTPEQWKNLGWLRPTITSRGLLLKFVPNRNCVTKKVDYAVYHGRFVEAMLTHCDLLFSSATVSALPANGDTVTSQALAHQ